MARIAENDPAPILLAAQGWRDRCLLGNGAVFSQENIWSSQNLSEFASRFVDHPIEGGEKDFYMKLQEQLSSAPAAVCKLSAEMLWVYFLFPTKVSPDTKREGIIKVWAWSGENLSPSDPNLQAPLEHAIGFPGAAYHTLRDRELRFFTVCLQEWKAQPPNIQESLLADPWNFGLWLDGMKDSEHRMFRHVLLYLLFPDHYERIASKDHKAKIRDAFSSYLKNYTANPEIRKGSQTELDHQLFHIRHALEVENPSQSLDFYWSPWEGVWRGNGGPASRYWIEKTLVKGRPDREQGENALGKALWSPQNSKDGRWIYQAMLQAAVGDVVYHLTDNEAIIGASRVAEKADDTFVGVAGTEWEGRPAFRIRLEDFKAMVPPLHRNDFLVNPRFQDRLRKIVERQKNLFYTKGLQLNQGNYLTQAPLDLIHILADAYQEKTQQRLPYFDELLPPSSVANWIFQANPDLYDINRALKTLNEMRWTVAQHAKKIRRGDRVFLWKSGKESGLIALATVRSDPGMLPPDPLEMEFAKDKKKFDHEQLSVRIAIDEVLPSPLSRDFIRQYPELSELPILRAPQGTNFPITETQAKILLELTKERGNNRQPRFTVVNFSEESGFAQDVIDQWKTRLLRKKHIVLQGPPGTGKTFIAERLARLLVSETGGFQELVQFHPSYAYEDFMQGIRPEVVEGKLSFKLSPGRFLQFCQNASKRDASQPCVLIVDEINRANLSRVFGELMYLLEYRQKSIPLSTSGEHFAVPGNVYIIGTMNTADRSIALVDHALRRRFSFIFIGPEYDVLRRHLERNHFPTHSLITALKSINLAIQDRNYELGISFFLAVKENLKETLPIIWSGEIEPYLEEYFFDQPDKVDGFRWDKLSRGVLSDWIS